MGLDVINENTQQKCSHCVITYCVYVTSTMVLSLLENDR